MNTLILSALLVLVSTLGFARDSGNIVQVKRKPRMSYLEPLPPKEYFIDLGERDGLKAGDVVQVYRSLGVVNGVAGQPWHLMRVNIGEMNVVAVGESASLARVEREREPSSLPPMRYQSFMVGDEVLKKQLPTN